MKFNTSNYIRALCLALALLTLCLFASCGGGRETESETESETEEGTAVPVPPIDSSLIYSDYAFLLLRGEDTPLAGLSSDKKIYPASLTKVMTFIVAYEKAQDLTALVEITEDIKSQYPEASRLGIDEGDLMTVEQMLYAMLLCSDTDATLGLALHIAGSEAAFVALMNQKAEAMGLTATHFTNVTGLHHKEHYSTAGELAAIMDYALDIPLGRTIMTTESYVTRLKYYKNGVLSDYRMTFNNTTLRERFSDNKVSLTTQNGITVLGGKTGYTEEADRCLATVAKDSEGREYILITCHAGDGKKTALDAVAIYENYAK